MTAEDRTRWDDIYHQRHNDPYPLPDPILFEYVPVPSHPEARALDFAAGLGQNGLWLATQGYIVDIMDISRVGLARARAEMAIRNLRNINLLQVDIDDITLDPARYDVVCVFRYLKREMFSQLRETIKPGGRIVYVTYNQAYLEAVAGFNPDFLLRPDEPARYFAGWQVLLDEQIGHTTQFIAVKPTHEPSDDDQDQATANDDDAPAPPSQFDW